MEPGLFLTRIIAVGNLQKKTNNQIGICFFQNKKKKWGSHQAHEL